MSQKLSVIGFKRAEELFEFAECFIKNYNEKCKEEHFLEFDTQYPEELHKDHYDLPFLPEIIIIGKVEKTVAILHCKNKNVIRIKNLKEVLNQALVLKKVRKSLSLIKRRSWKKP